MDINKLLPTKDFQYSSDAKQYMNLLLFSLATKFIDNNNLNKILPEYIADGAKMFIQKSIKYNKSYLSIDKLKIKNISIENKKIISYLLQYIGIEILDLAVNYCRDLKKKRVMKSHIEYVIKEDPELNQIF